MQQRRPVMQTKIKNLITGKIVETNFQQSDNFDEAEISKSKVKYLYTRRRPPDGRQEYWFCEENDPSKRFKLDERVIGESGKFLKANTIVDAMLFNDDIINITLPVKMEFKIKEAPPSIKGNTASGGTKVVTLENGSTIDAPLFVNAGDVIRVNTQTGEYTERVEKG
jgi:elongation factor P